MTDENYYKKRLQSLTVSLQRTVECPVCFETMKIPFKVCSRGHGVCLDCNTKLEKCPTCEETFVVVLENLICMKNLLEALPRLCCYTDYGCEEVVEPGSDHEMFCGFRTFVCHISECNEEMPINQVQAHYAKHHGNKCKFTKECKTFDKGIRWENNKEYVMPVFLFGNLFWIVEKADTKTEQLTFFFVATPIRKLEHDYYVQIKLEKDEFAYTYTLKAVFKCTDSEFNKNKGKITEEMMRTKDKYCMKIPLCELSRFKENDGYVKCMKYSFFKK